MANKDLFKSSDYQIKPLDTVNAAGGGAYTLEVKEALAQFAMTNTFGGSFYVSGKDQLHALKELVDKVDDNEFIASLAVYSRNKGHMKDMPAYLLAVLANRDTDLLKEVFFDVVDNAKMLKNFVQIIRSGVTGRRSLGTVPKKLVRTWIRKRNVNQLLNDSVGGEVKLRDIIKMTHVKPKNKEQEALFGYLIGHTEKPGAMLPKSLAELKAFHRGETDNTPNLNFQLLTGSELNTNQWKKIAKDAPWQMTRMNLNTFLRHGIFDSEDMVSMIADRLRNPEKIRAAKVMPYQLLSAYLNVAHQMPASIVSALHDALEIACENIPSFGDKKVVMAIDVSGSMSQPVTGARGGATTKTECVHVAGLIASAMLRKNPNAVVILFEENIIHASIDSRDTVLTNASLIARLRGGGTNCGKAMQYINEKHADADLVMFVSDNESWGDYQGIKQSRYSFYYPEPTGQVKMAESWAVMRKKNAKSKLVLMDLVPSIDSQNHTQDSVLNIGGFSDKVFEVIKSFVDEDVSGKGHWVKRLSE